MTSAFGSVSDIYAGLGDRYMVDWLGGPPLFLLESLNVGLPAMSASASLKELSLNIIGKIGSQEEGILYLFILLG